MVTNNKTVNEVTINSWSNKKLSYKPNKYPQSTNKDLPNCYFVSLFVGSRGTGKTYSICSLLKQYERATFDGNQAMRIILFSPTHDANPVFSCLRNLAESDIINNYSDANLIEMIGDIKHEKEETEKYQKEKAIYSKFVRGDVDNLSLDEVHVLEKLDYCKPDEKQVRFPHGVVNYMIFDDLIGSSAFKAVGKSALTNLTLKNRHLGINIIIATQNLKAIPKSIRSNASIYVLFKFANNKILDDLYEEVSSTLTFEDFVKIYVYSTIDPHDCLVIDFTCSKDCRFKKSFKTVLSLT